MFTFLDVCLNLISGENRLANLPQSLLQLQGGIKYFGARAIFTGASFAVNEGEKIGVIGPNGAGKSTLFRILIGDQSLDDGQLTRANGLKVGYLAQEDSWQGDVTVEDHLTSQDTTPLWELKRLAPQFGLAVADFAKPVRSFSGGYRMRVKLLYLLASKPDLMLLDEPTNYLDLETLLVLENFLLSLSSAFLLISHDREFLRRTTDHVLEIEAGQMTKYAGNIDDYFEQKALLREQLLKSAASADAKRREVLDFVARFGAKATKAKQAQSRLKRLDKMETIEVKPVATRARIRMPIPQRTGRTVLAVKEASLGYGERVVLSQLHFELGIGDRLGVVGVNGAGKSTLLKALAQELRPISGQIALGANVKIGYYAQHVAERLHVEDTVFTAMSADAHPSVSRQEVLDLAGSLLFGGDEIGKKVAMLSGGEKSRVALGRILLQRTPCLLLDEPTNHLDFDTVEALTQSLAEYQGTLVIVSHDRGFVSRTANKILEIRSGRAEFYPGTYDEYVWSVQKGVLAERQEYPTPQSTLVAAAPVEEKTNYKERKKNLERDLKRHEKDMEKLEAKASEGQARILELTSQLFNLGGQAAAELALQITALQTAVDEAEQAYLASLENRDLAKKELFSMENRFNA